MFWINVRSKQITLMSVCNNGLTATSGDLWYPGEAVYAHLFGLPSNLLDHYRP